MRSDFSLNSNNTSDYEKLATLETVETVVRTKDKKFPMFSVGWTWHGFLRKI